ncbi:hypothetical protein C7477_10553 [Phyllobacterium leguminum]|uniref:Uncharacterized protein n=2 Tax=Phyllobacterium leguminum TaxID=314237 RepID=A0A318TIR2_9HYPH|nr:hypothetical protein C7477_10553 [Phyllobacterium leguminum]
MVDPLDPNLQPGRTPPIDDPLVDRPRPMDSGAPGGGIASSTYLWAAVLLVIILGALYYVYSSGDMASAPPPPQPATPTAPAPG